MKSDWTEEEVTPGDMYYRIDQKKLVKWLKHLRTLNQLLKNDLQRDDVQRAEDRGRFDAYSCLLGDIQSGTIFMKK